MGEKGDFGKDERIGERIGYWIRSYLIRRMGWFGGVMRNERGLVDVRKKQDDCFDWSSLIV